MKISYRTHPILKILENGVFDGVRGGDPIIQVNGTPKALKLIPFFQQVTPCFYPIISLSKNFVYNLRQAFDKMIVDDLWKNMGICNGCLSAGHISYCYYIECIPGNESHNVVFFIFYDSFFVGFLNQNIKDNERYLLVNDDFKFLYDATNSNNPKKLDWRDDYIEISYTELVAALNFIKYAPVETKHLAPGQKIKGIDCNYKNETKSPVTILDSTWFTNLVKSDAFKVRGHFRLQPKKKDGEWTKELIWISDFMKTGYTRKAGKLQEGEA